MPGPLPSDSPNRQRRPATDVPWIEIPAEGRSGPIPKCPLQLGPMGQAWWDRAWRSPVSVLWHDGHELDMAARRAYLQDAIDPDSGELPPATILSEMRHLEAMLLLTYKARKEARVRIVAADGTADRPEPPKPRRPGGERRSKLRVVDTQAAG